MCFIFQKRTFSSLHVLNALGKSVSSLYCCFVFPLQEFIAYGLMNVIGSFFSSFTAAGSLSRSTVQANSGGKTQVLDYAHRHTHT